MTNDPSAWGDLLTRASVWLALLGYLFGPLAGLLGRQSTAWQRFARLAYSCGWLAFVVHAIAAFAFFYRWSHSVALDETARQTFEATGHSSAVGLYLNYLFLILWALGVGWWWRAGLTSYRLRRRWVGAALHGFLLFMAFNATVVFETGVVRWAGWLGTVLIGTVLIVSVAVRAMRGARA